MEQEGCISLSKNGIQMMYNTQAALNQNVLVQALEMRKKKDKKGKQSIICQLSDGSCKFKGVISSINPPIDIELVNDNNCILRIRQHLLLEIDDIKKALEIIQYEIVARYDGIVGNPMFIDSPQIKEHASKSTANVLNKEKMIKTVLKEKENNSELIQSQKKKTNSSSQLLTSTKKNKDNVFLEISQQQEEIEENAYRAYEKISDLYVDLQGWEIICRLAEKKYREFNSKNGKFTKMLTLQLVDRTGMCIEGAMFGESAIDFHEALKEDQVYKISQGQIREENYKNNKGPKQSRHNILFTRISKFHKVTDNKLIPTKTLDEVSIHQVLQENNFERQYNVCCILNDIREQIQIEKSGKTLFKQNIIVSDPEHQKTIQVVLWNRNVSLDQKLLNSAVILKGFRLHEYQENIFLNSMFRSEIIPFVNSKYEKYQNKQDFSNYKNISKSQSKRIEKDEKVCLNLKQLQSQILYLESGNSYIISDLHVSISHISVKGKWYYQACPKCKKSANAFSTCNSCGKVISVTNSRFILPVELSDPYGSIWVTAFDEFGLMIFKDIDINALKRFDESQLKEEVQKKVFQEFKVRVQTKKVDGNIKHVIVGKIKEINQQQSAIQMLKRLKERI